MPDDSILESLYLKRPFAPKSFYKLGACSHCHQIGYRGRKGLFELMLMDDTLRDLIQQSAPATEIKKQALSQGMTTLRQAGIETIENGLTTVEEVLNYT